MSYVLYNKNNHPVVCERKDWKKCPEHKHLTDKKPKSKLAKLEDRTKPPYVITIDEDDDGTVTMLDTDGNLYWKQYDSYGAGVGSGKISGLSKMFYSKKIKKAIEEAWVVYDEQQSGKKDLWEGFNNE